ncbi:MAG TPA: hypothetical protein VFE23_19685 [Usitatibacter sp.]|nr:hypothetical protein [Usitatibacter sp.]
MFLLRVLLPLAVMVLVGFGIAFVASRDRKYLRYLILAFQLELLVIVGFGLLYLVERLFLA